MPGIIHGYFGQVGKQILPKSSAAGSQSASVPPSADSHVATSPPKHPRSDGQPSRSASTGSLGSLVEVDRDHIIDTPPTSDDMSYSTPEKRDNQDGSDLPPTPISADPCEVENNGQAAENGGPLADGGLSSITQALRNLVRPKSTFSAKAQRHQSLPTSSVTRSSVPAAHFSNPTSCLHSPNSTSPNPPPVSDSLHCSTSVKELNKLTLDAAPESREKSTPPLTPRALSHSQDDKISGAKSPRSTTSATASDDGASGRTASSARQSDPLPTGTSRGKLAVRIAEGRNLRPSFDPYCVCVFEWNEYISKGPRQDRMDVDDDQKKPANLHLPAVPIRRTDSDMGRPMAVPMRSRQSSNNGLDENKGMEKVTDPQWDHEATLYVSPVPLRIRILTLPVMWLVINPRSIYQCTIDDPDLPKTFSWGMSGRKLQWTKIQSMSNGCHSHHGHQTIRTCLAKYLYECNSRRLKRNILDPTTFKFSNLSAKEHSVKFTRFERRTQAASTR